MTTDDTPGAVTICAQGRMGLYADDLGVTVRRSSSRADRFAWAEVARFADGCETGEGGRPIGRWRLVIVLHEGRQVPVECRAWAPITETVRVIREVAGRHGVPAEVAGIPMRDGRPHEPGLYQDPGGQAALRYWTGAEWSPLLPPDVKLGAAWESVASWTALPTAAGPWAYAAARVRRATVWFAVLAAVLATSAAGLVIELWWHPGLPHRNTGPASGFFVVALSAALGAVLTWSYRGEFIRLDQAARRAADGWSPLAGPERPAAATGGRTVADEMAGAQPPPRARRRQVILALVPVVSLTVLAWVPFLWLALIRRRRRDWGACCAYLLAPLAAIACFVLAARGSTAAGGLGAFIVWCVVLVAPIHAIVEFRPAAAVPSWRDAREERASSRAVPRFGSGPGTIALRLASPSL